MGNGRWEMWEGQDWQERREKLEWGVKRGAKQGRDGTTDEGR